MDKKPLFRHIRDVLAERIASGQLKPGDQVPTELELCEEFDTTRVTVRRAIDELVDERLLVRQGRKGTFVAAHRWERELHRFHSLYEDLERRGLKPVTQVLDMRIIEAPEEVAAMLHLAPKERVVHLHRLRSVNGEPLVIMEDYVPLRRCPQLLEDDLTAHSLYWLLEEKYGFRAAMGKQTFYVERLSRKQAALLQAGRNEAAFAMRAMVYLEDGTPLLLGTYLFRSDKYSFTVTLPRR